MKANGDGKWKASRYNHFVEIGDGKRLAFNAMTCGLAEMNEDVYQKLQSLGNGGCPEETDSELLKNFRLGNFLIPEDLDELDLIRANHYMARFANRNFGLTIIPTQRCNFACDYCYESSELRSAKPSDQTDMSDDVCNNIVGLCEQRIAEKSVFGVTWYGGEPLLRKDIIGKLSEHFVRICKAKQSRYHAGIITNGYLLTKENLDFLIKSKVTFAQVTVDGPREVHDRRRCLKGGGETYDRIMANLAHIQNETKLAVSFRVNIDKRNTDSIRSLLEDLKNRGLHKQKNFSVNFGHVFYSKGACPGISSQCMVPPEFSDFIVNACRLTTDMGFRQTMYPSRIYISCGAVTGSSAVIEPDGTVRYCWETVGDEAKKVGMLTVNGIEYNSNALKWLGWTPFAKECNSCDLLPVCLRGCPLRTVYQREAEELGKTPCCAWKYNLERMLPLTKRAKEQGLLVEGKRPDRASGSGPSVDGSCEPGLPSI